MKKSLLHPSLEVQREPPLNYGELKEGKEEFIKFTEKVPPCYLCEIKNAYVSPFGVVFKNGCVVKESVYSMFTRRANYLTFYKKILLGKVKKVSGNCLVAHNAYYDNYYHWTLEALPRIFSIKEHASELTLVIPVKSKPFIDQYIDLFNFKAIVKIKEDELVLSENVWLPTHTAPGLCHNELLIKQMADFVKSKIRFNKQEFSHLERVFVSRDKATYRRAINEAEAFCILKDYGFSKVYLEDLNLSEQINLMRSVKYLAGIHGAGFSNLIFMDKGECLIDIIHENHRQNTFYNLASAFGLNYCRIECKGIEKENYEGADDIFINIEKLREAVNSLSGERC